MSEIEISLEKYVQGYNSLWNQVNKNNSEFPKGSVSIGTIGEYYAKKYLEEKYADSIVEYGRANEKSWDIKVKNGDSQVLFQVKSTSVFNSSRTLSKLNRGFDQLIVINLDRDFFPFQAYLFETVDHLFANTKSPALITPNPDNVRQTGSLAFKQAKNIHNDFFEILANKL
ncbi:hypothetical protein [uncultured Psychromonas sp.]|uniref:hypothetical protein n=1 Tax=uncultured Psychromonas sp. TaxID=173974 RepID=UPI002639E83A|nr:hypothetical protein [uncultured Psychromonas sp.]